MKTNGLRNKKPAMARMAWRACGWAKYWTSKDGKLMQSEFRLMKWHRAAKGRK